MSQLFVSGETHDGFHAATEAIGLPHPGSLKALIALDAAAAQRLCNGVALIESVADGGEGLLRAHDELGALIALARRNFSEGGAKIQPISVFVRNPATPA